MATGSHAFALLPRACPGRWIAERREPFSDGWHRHQVRPRLTPKWGTLSETEEVAAGPRVCKRSDLVAIGVCPIQEILEYIETTIAVSQRATGEHHMAPFARPRSRFTRAFESVVAWLATRTDQSAIATFCRIDWDTVGRICERVVADELDDARLDSLVRIGVDEVSWRKHHNYLTLVVDHETGKVVWGAEGKDSATLSCRETPQTHGHHRRARPGRDRR